MLNNTTKFHEIITGSTKVMLTSHLGPDADAIGTLLGLYSYLIKKYPGKQIEMFLTGEKREEWSFLKFAEQINWVESIATFLQQYSTIIFLDGNGLNRFIDRDFLSLADLSGRKTICIDHHQGSTFTDLDIDLSDSTSASASQLIYKYFFRDEPELLDKETAEILMLGILGDTGSLKYVKPHNSDTLVYAKELLDIGNFDLETLDLKLSQFETEDFEVLKLFMANTQHVQLPGIYGFSYTYLPKEATSQFSMKAIKSAAATYKVIILRQTKGYEWGFIVTPSKTDEFSISFRSSAGRPNVRLIAEKFEGGGHNMAAGGHYVLQNDEASLNTQDICLKVIDTIKTSELEILPS